MSHVEMLVTIIEDDGYLCFMQLNGEVQGKVL